MKIADKWLSENLGKDEHAQLLEEMTELTNWLLEKREEALKKGSLLESVSVTEKAVILRRKYTYELILKESRSKKEKTYCLFAINSLDAINSVLDFNREQSQKERLVNQRRLDFFLNAGVNFLFVLFGAALVKLF